MSVPSAESVGGNVKKARLATRMTQADLATRAGLERLRVVRIERGTTLPRLDEAVRLGAALGVPLEWIVYGRLRPGGRLEDIAVELLQLGVWDLRTADPTVPGAFRRPEEVLVLALSGDRPEPRVVEAVPYLLSRVPFHRGLTLAFAAVFDRRVRTRLAWLSELTRELGREGVFAVSAAAERRLAGFVRAGVKGEPDGLGYPSENVRFPIWRRWNITYASGPEVFRARSIELEIVGQMIRSLLEGAE